MINIAVTRAMWGFCSLMLHVQHPVFAYLRMDGFGPMIARRFP